MREPAWRKTGSMPDYRFSLANETTFLAWIRTSLALIVGALGIDQLFPDIAPAPLRIAMCVALALIGAVLAIVAYRPVTGIGTAVLKWCVYLCARILRPRPVYS